MDKEDMKFWLRQHHFKELVKALEDARARVVEAQLRAEIDKQGDLSGSVGDALVEMQKAIDWLKNVGDYEERQFMEEKKHEQE